MKRIKTFIIKCLESDSAITDFIALMSIVALGYVIILTSWVFK